MRIMATRNHNEVGIERVDRDGEVSVVKDEDVEVSVDERMEWYNNAELGKERELEVEKNDGGHPMGRNEKLRTSLPRPGEYSTERRLEEERNPGSTTDFKSEATLEQAMGKAFCMVAPVVMASTKLSPVKVASISRKTGVDVVDVLRLEEIAIRNPDLVAKAITRIISRASAAIPGLVEEEGGQIAKEGEPDVKPCSKCRVGKPSAGDGEEMKDDELAQVGVESGLCE
jgi:hypothetical protein